jgi:hypothetical protein
MRKNGVALPQTDIPLCDRQLLFELLYAGFRAENRG